MEMKDNFGSKGYTLIELMIVIAILGIMGGILIPRGSSYQKYRLKVYAEQLCEDIRFVRHWNMNNEGNCHLALSTQHYRIVKNTAIYKRVDLPLKYNIYFTQGKETLRFTSKGVPRMGGCSIRIADTKLKASMEITVVPASGRVLLKDEIIQN